MSLRSPTGYCLLKGKAGHINPKDIQEASIAGFLVCLFLFRGS